VKYYDYGLDETGDGFDIEEFLERTQRQQQDRLDEELRRIEKQLESRQELFKTTKAELESKLEWYIERLEQAYRLSKDVENLKQKVSGFYDQIREERLRHWQDKQELEQERRELLREIREIEESDLDSLL